MISSDTTIMSYKEEVKSFLESLDNPSIIEKEYLYTDKFFMRLTNHLIEMIECQDFSNLDEISSEILILIGDLNTSLVKIKILNMIESCLEFHNNKTIFCDYNPYLFMIKPHLFKKFISGTNFFYNEPIKKFPEIIDYFILKESTSNNSLVHSSCLTDLINQVNINIKYLIKENISLDLDDLKNITLTLTDLKFYALKKYKLDSNFLEDDYITIKKSLDDINEFINKTTHILIKKENNENN